MSKIQLTQEDVDASKEFIELHKEYSKINHKLIMSSLCIGIPIGLMLSVGAIFLVISMTGLTPSNDMTFFCIAMATLGCFLLTYIVTLKVRMYKFQNYLDDYCKKHVAGPAFGFYLLNSIRF